MTLPKPDPKISLGNLINLIALLVAFAAGYGIMSERGENTRENMKELRETLRLESSNRMTSQRAIEERIRNLENHQTRNDERFTSIIGLLERSDSKLQRIESKLEGGTR